MTDYPDAGASERMGQVSQAISHVDKVLSDCLAHAETLAQRLEPIMLPAKEPGPADTSAGVKVGRVELAASIDCLGARAEELSNRLNSFLKRIEL